MPSNCTLWMMDGKLVVDDSGAPILSEDCPCGDCCEQLVKWAGKMFAETNEVCKLCDQGDEGCGECYTTDSQEPGVWVNVMKNPIMSFETGGTGECNSGFQVVSQPEDGTSYKDGELVTIRVCGSTFTVPYTNTEADPPVCSAGEGCWQFIKAFCDTGERLFPVIGAPDPPSHFSRPSTKCKQEYWGGCFDPNPTLFVKCGFLVNAPRFMFDDYSGSDDTLVWGVVGCFCEGNGKWKMRKLCGGDSGNGLIIVDAPFVPETTSYTDDKGVTYDVPVCGITCQGQKDLVEEMTSHYEHYLEDSGSAIRATTDVDVWNGWTGESRSDACFWGYVPISAVYAYQCIHLNDNNEWEEYDHYILFDCDCNMSEVENVHQEGGSLSLEGAGLYPTDLDLCDAECPDLWALMAYSKGRGWSRSHAQDSDPRGSADEGVIITKDSRLPNGSIYSIGGTATFFAAWGSGDGSTSGQDYLIWIDCDCHAHVECITNDGKKFLKYKDACTCLDWREIVDDNVAVFGVVDKQWGSHVIVQWTHTSASASYEGPYWLYNNPSTDEQLFEIWCDTCTRQYQGAYKKYYNAFVDWNMLVVHRIVNGEHEIGHVQKTGGIVNYRLNASGSTMAGVTAAQVRSIFADMCVNDPSSESCPNGDSGAGTFGGWYIEPYSYSMTMMFGTSLNCKCEYDPGEIPDPPICGMPDRVLNPDTMYLSGTNRNYHRCYSLVTTPRKDTVPGRQVVSCDGSCTWEHARINWTIFCASYFRTSCGLLVNGEQDKYYLPSLFIPGYSGTTAQKAIAAIERQYGYFNGIIPEPNSPYPSNDETVTAYPPNNAQPALCHKTQCGGYTQYASLDEYCAQFAGAATKPTECKCLLDATSSECVDIEPPSSN